LARRCEPRRRRGAAARISKAEVFAVLHRLVRSALVTATSAIIVGTAACSGGTFASGHGFEPFAAPHTRLSARFARIDSQPPVQMAIAFLMTDGTVVAQDNYSGGTWYRYAPDAKGGYADGTWTQIASLQPGYSPAAFASQVLADGRLVISGGEFNGVTTKYALQLTNLGASYDPVANTWTPLGHPKGWQWIGDSPSSLLPDGRMLLGQKLTERDASLDPKTLTWTSVGDRGKSDFNAEEGWTLLPDGTVLTADVKDAPNSEIYTPARGTWKSAGSTIVDLHSPYVGGCVRYGPRRRDCYNPPGEIGPAILRPDGSVFYTGAGSGLGGRGAGHTAIYRARGSNAGTWAAGPDFPNDDNAGDSYAVLEPSGNVLVFGASGKLYEWNGSSFPQVGGPYVGAPLLLPTGQVLILTQSVVLYTPPGKPKAAWAPSIETFPKRLNAGKTYKITGTQFTGLSQAMSFGDEDQNATSYPLVRIRNAASGDVFYARTHDHSTMGVATGSKTVWTYFDVPTGIETGASVLEVVANGIPSRPVHVTVSR
jgi:hypothetical protein